MRRSCLITFKRVADTKKFCSTSSNITVQKFENGVAHLSLDRNIGKNSLSKGMLNDLIASIADLHVDKNVKVLLIKSSIDKVFCAGADLKERMSMTAPEVGEFVDKIRGTFQAVAELPFPTIAVIEGAAVGGGLELALACDIRIAGSKSVLGLPETSLAIIPGAGGTQRLPRIVGIAKAKELIFTSARLNAEEAAAIGLVNKCVEANEALATAEGIALKIVQNGPVAVRSAKAAIDEGYDADDLKQALQVERKCYGIVLNTADRMEGINSFVEKRRPVYKGL